MRLCHSLSLTEPAPSPARMKQINRYYDPGHISAALDRGDHRGVIGGMWDEIGPLQFDYMRKLGLRPDMYLLDIGCGCLRGGVQFVNYLEAGHYYGCDLSQDLLDAGYDIELAAAGLQAKLPRENLRSTDAFDIAPFERQFDMAIAVSVFSHLTLNHLMLCLARLADAMRPDGVFCATLFHCPDNHDWTQPLQHPAGKRSYPDRDPYHYRRVDLKRAIGSLPWALECLEDWNHPRNQWMARFRRL